MTQLCTCTSLPSEAPVNPSTSLTGRTELQTLLVRLHHQEALKVHQVTIQTCFLIYAGVKEAELLLHELLDQRSSPLSPKQCQKSLSKKQEIARLPQSSPFVLYLEEKPIADIQPHIALLPLPFLLDISCIKAVVKPKQIYVIESLNVH